MPTDYTWTDAVNMVSHARQGDSPTIQRMAAVRLHYNGDVVVPTYDVPGEDTPARAPNPLLIADSIESNAMAASSLIPTISAPIVGTNNNKNRTLRDNKIRGYRAVWHHSGMKEMLLPRFYRHLFAYATGAMVVMWDEEKEMPIIEMRDALSTYAEPKAPEDFSPPGWIGHIYARSTHYLLAKYPQLVGVIDQASRQGHDDLWDVLEFTDDSKTMVGVLGPRQPFTNYSVNNAYTPLAWAAEHRSFQVFLKAWENKAGCVPAYMPRRVTLDRIESNVMKLTGLVNEIGTMRTLEKIAAERGIFPDLVAFGDSEQPVTISNGRWIDGREGDINLIQNARGFNTVRMDPSVVSRQVTDIMERSFMQSGELDPMQVGESRGASLRTGSALNQMADFTIDKRIQEAHLLMGRVLTVMNEIVAKVWRAYGGTKDKEIYAGEATDQRIVTINPRKVYETPYNDVQYPIPGATITNIQVALGQAMQTGQMSRDTARRHNPLIKDEEGEGTQIVVEGAEQAVVQAFIAQAQDPQSGMTLIDLAEFIDRFRASGDLTAALRRMDELARERQANQNPTPEQMVGGVDAGNPGAVAGGGGTGAPGPGAAFPGPSRDGQRLRQLTTNLNSAPSAPNRIPSSGGR